jgi:long-chain fatty acid transport protein
MQRVLVVILSILAVLATCSQALAAGFQAYFEQSAAAMGQAAAVVAQASEPSALFYNPAAACLLPGTQMDVTLNGLVQQSTFIPIEEDTQPDRASTSASEAPIPIPAFHLTHQANDRFMLGLGINTPYGSATDWSSTWDGRYYAGYTGLKSVYAAPTLGYRLTDRLSLGAALLAVWSEATVEKAINAPLVFAAAAPELAPAYMGGASSPTNDIQTRIQGDDWGFGTRLGLHWQLSDCWTVGAAYQSEVSLDPAGRATYTIPEYDDADFGREVGSGATANQLAPVLFPDSDIETHITLPATLTGGVAFAILGGLRLETDLTWTGWSSYDSLNVTYASLAGESNATSSTPKLWKDTLTFRIGAQYPLGDRFVYRVGYAFDESPIPDDTRDPSLPGADRHDLTTGIGYGYGSWEFDAAYLYAMISDSPSEQDSAMNGDLSGSYEASAHVLAVGVTHRF